MNKVSTFYCTFFRCVRCSCDERMWVFYIYKFGLCVVVGAVARLFNLIFIYLNFCPSFIRTECFLRLFIASIFLSSVHSLVVVSSVQFSWSCSSHFESSKNSYLIEREWTKMNNFSFAGKNQIDFIGPNNVMKVYVRCVIYVYVAVCKSFRNSFCVCLCVLDKSSMRCSFRVCVFILCDEIMR